MLSQFRSAVLVSKVPLLFVLLATFSAASMFVATPTLARMDNPVPAPHLEGWPDPDHGGSTAREPDVDSKLADPTGVSDGERSSGHVDQYNHDDDPWRGVLDRLLTEILIWVRP